MFKSKYFKYLVTFVLVTIFVLSSFSVSSYASETITYSLYDFTFISGTKPNSFERQYQNGKYYTLISLNTTSPSSDGGGAKYCAVSKVSDKLKIGNSYTLTYSVRSLQANNNNYSFSFYMTDDPSNMTPDNAVQFAFFESPSTSFQDYNIQFQFPNQFNGKQVYLVFVVVADFHGNGFLVSDFSFTNNDNSNDNIDNVLEWLNRIYYSISGGIDSSGVTHIGIVKSIQNLGSSLDAKLTSCTSDLTSKLDSCKSALISHLTTCTNTLWRNLQSALNTINSNLLLFKHSVESSFNNLSTFLDSKFTVLFDKLDTLIKGKEVNKDDFGTENKDKVDDINKDIEDTESNLPDFDGSDFDKVINTDILSDLSKGFIAVNSVFSIVIDKLGFTAVIVFFLSFGLAIYIIGRRLG